MKKLLAGIALASMMVTVAPRPALADGAASTRNILLGGAALYWLISANNQHQRALRQRRAYAQQRRYYGYNGYNGYNNGYGGYRDNDRHRYHRRKHHGRGHGEGHEGHDD